MASKVVESWRTIRVIPNYENIVGELLFRKIFTLAPQLHAMFPFAQDFEPMSDELFASERFKRHARGVVITIGNVVSTLGPDLDPHIETLHELGKRHGSYGALPAHYAIVGRALIETQSEALGGQFTDELKVSWTCVYDKVSAAMIKGAEGN
jgi:hemoglobin-like flavoprotein